MCMEAAAAGTKTYPVFEEVLAPSGKIVQAGMGADRVPISVLRLQWQRLHIHGSVGHSGGDLPPLDPPAGRQAHQPPADGHCTLQPGSDHRGHPASREAAGRQGHGVPMRTSLTATPSAARFAPIVCRGDLRQAFDLAAALGYDGVELHLRRPTDVDQADLLKLLADSGLGVPTLGTGMAAGEDGLTFAHHDPAIRAEAVARIEEHIHLAASIGSAVTIGLIWGRMGADPVQRSERMKTALGCLAECCRTAESEGVTLLLEPLNRYESDYPQTVEQGLEIISTVGSPRLRLLADTFHMNIEETSILASLKAARQHLGHVHLADSNRQAPGHGHLDIAAVVQTLRDIGYTGYLSLEVLPLPDTRGRGRRRTENHPQGRWLARWSSGRSSNDGGRTSQCRGPSQASC